MNTKLKKVKNKAGFPKEACPALAIPRGDMQKIKHKTP